MKPADLSNQLQAVWRCRDTAKKRELAYELADSFKLGGRDHFINDLAKCRTAAQIDQLCTNAMLKGEGNGVK